MSFGEGVPDDNDHTIPLRREVLESGDLPPYRLQLVKDLLERAKLKTGNVGKYVLYAGKKVNVRRGSTQKLWMEGIVISERDNMCEVGHTLLDNPC